MKRDILRGGPVTVAVRLVEALLAQGVDHVFCVPGESYLAVLDALHDRRDLIRTITCRHEGAAANMAEAYGKLTGRPGICMVTRGPGATHASVGVHTAEQDSTPMILFVGQIARGHRGRGAFQEVDYRQMFGGLAKGVIELNEPDRTEEIVHRAFATALNGRRGPVVISLPEDILDEAAGGDNVNALVTPARIGLDASVLDDIHMRLLQAARPLLLLGGSGWTEAASTRIVVWAERLHLPILLSFRRKALVDNRSPAYVGDLGLGANPALAARVREADLLIAVGARLGENPTAGYTLLTRGQTAQALVHIHPDANEIGRVWPAAIGAVADVVAAAEGLASLEPPTDWSAWCAAARADLARFSSPIAVTGAVNLSEVFTALRAALPDDAIVTNGAGNFAAWLHRFFPHHGFATQLAPTSGAMGYGLPAGIAAKLRHPQREVVAVAGDGCFLMVAQELATVARYDLGVIVILVDNGAYGTIRMHQERDYPGRTIATDLSNPDFESYAKAFSVAYHLVERTADFPAELAAARQSRRAALIHLKTSLEDIAPGRTLSGLAADGVSPSP